MSVAQTAARTNLLAPSTLALQDALAAAWQDFADERGFLGAQHEFIPQEEVAGMNQVLGTASDFIVSLPLNEDERSIYRIFVHSTQGGIHTVTVNGENVRLIGNHFLTREVIRASDGSDIVMENVMAGWLIIAADADVAPEPAETDFTENVSVAVLLFEALWTLPAYRAIARRVRFARDGRRLPMTS